MGINVIHRIKTISEYFKLRGLPKPQHPLISLVNFDNIKYQGNQSSSSWVLDFYSIALKRNFGSKIKYGQQEYDFDEGILFFIAPGQVFSIEINNIETFKPSGWMLLIHPDFLWNTALAKNIKQYGFFGYSVNEALFLSDKEETTLLNVFLNIEEEYNTNIDKFSQDVIIAQLELLLTYADRFYHRQFITRKITNHKILGQLEDLLNEYFNDENLINKGLPSVDIIASQLNVSINYLSNLLKTLTGHSTQQHIHNKLIEKAKEKLSTTNLTVNEIAFTLGFEHSQSFSKLFKAKTDLSPTEFRASFN
jgi:AraC family transcriptional regulator, transcriptional activator of pobA